MADVLQEVIDEWVAGWVVSRRADLVATFPDAHLIEVGTAAENGRFVLRSTDGDAIRARAESVTRERFWVKGPIPSRGVPAVFGDEWALEEGLHLMTASLRSDDIRELAEGYRLETTDEGDAVRAHVVTADGTVAASGRAGFTATAAIPDQIVTAPGHRRLGLARAIVQTLINVGVERGLRDGILLASVEGGPLYETMGWQFVAPFFQAEHGPVAAL